MAKHTVCHIQWSSTDLERTKKFLAGLFDWEFANWGPDYITFKPKEGPGGGLMKVDRVKAGSSPVVYIEVEEIEPLLNKAKELGGGGWPFPRRRSPGWGGMPTSAIRTAISSGSTRRAASLFPQRR